MKKTVSLVLALVLCLGVSIALADVHGLGIVTDIGSSTSAYVKDGDAYDGRVQVNTVICSVVLDDEGVIVSIHFDVAQTRVGFTVEGEVTADLEAEQLSKKELKEGYGMVGRSEIGKEWYEQVQAFEEYCIGKTAEEIINLPTYARDESHTTVADVADLKTSCTIDVGEMIEALHKAVENAG